MAHPHISKIHLFPIKALGHIAVDHAKVAIHRLQWDRQYAIVQEDGGVITGKRDPRVNLLRSSYNWDDQSITLYHAARPQPTTFVLKEDNLKLDRYLSDYFKSTVHLKADHEGSFQDIHRIGSLSIYSESSLRALHTDLGRHEFDDLRLRFRANVELTGVEPYWEEQLYIKPGTGVRCRIGDVEAIGVAPRLRCPVPPMHTQTSERDDHFVADHIKHRMKHYGDKLLLYGKTSYYFAIDLFLPRSEEGKMIEVGDAVVLLEEVDLVPLNLMR